MSETETEPLYLDVACKPTLRDEDLLPHAEAAADRACQKAGRLRVGGVRRSLVGGEMRDGYEVRRFEADTVAAP